MLSWIADHASFVYAIVAFAALGVGLSYWMHRRVLHLAVLVGLVVLLVVLWFLFKLVPTDRKQIADNLQAMGRAVLDGDAKQLFRFVSKEFRYDGHTGEELYGRIDRTLKTHRASGLRIWDVDARPEGETASVDFYFRVDGQGETQFLARGKSRFAKEQGTWKMRTLAVFPVAGDQEMKVPLSP